MTNPKRYDPENHFSGGEMSGPHMDECENGEWVKWEDYERLSALERRATEPRVRPQRYFTYGDLRKVPADAQVTDGIYDGYRVLYLAEDVDGRTPEKSCEPHKSWCASVNPDPCNCKQRP